MKTRKLMFTNAQVVNMLKGAIEEERTRNAAIADAVERRALSDGMLAYAQCAKEIADGIRSKG